MLFRFFVTLLFCYSISLKAETLYVAVASNFMLTAKTLQPMFEKSTGHQLKLSFASTGKLYAQIHQGAPYDVFLAADQLRPRLLIEQGLALPSSQFTYAQGQTVLWSAQPELFNQHTALSYLKSRAFKQLALPNPKTAPYGQSAKKLLDELSISQKISKQLVRAESVSQSYQWLATHNIEAGFVALSQIKNYSKPHSLWVPSIKLMPLIAQDAVLLNKTENNSAAKDFVEFLQSSAAQAKIHAAGYR